MKIKTLQDTKDASNAIIGTLVTKHKAEKLPNCFGKMDCLITDNCAKCKVRHRCYTISFSTKDASEDSVVNNSLLSIT